MYVDPNQESLTSRGLPRVPAKTLRLMAEWPPHAIDEDERAAVLAGAEALEKSDQRRVQRLENIYQLVQERDQLKGLVTELRHLLQGLEWRPYERIDSDGKLTDDLRFFCAACSGWREQGHKPDCRLSNALAYAQGFLSQSEKLQTGRPHSSGSWAGVRRAGIDGEPTEWT